MTTCVTQATDVPSHQGPEQQLCTRDRVHTHPRACVHACKHMRTHPQTRLHTHTFTHIFACTHAHTRPSQHTSSQHRTWASLDSGCQSGAHDSLGNPHCQRLCPLHPNPPSPRCGDTGPTQKTAVQRSPSCALGGLPARPPPRLPPSTPPPSGPRCLLQRSPPCVRAHGAACHAA